MLRCTSADDTRNIWFTRTHLWRSVTLTFRNGLWIGWDGVCVSDALAWEAVAPHLDSAAHTTKNCPNLKQYNKVTHEFNVFFVRVTRSILYQYTFREGARVSSHGWFHGCRMAAWPPPRRRCSSHINHKTMKRRPACAGQRKTFKYHRRCWMKCRTKS